MNRPKRNINENEQKQSKIELRRPGRDLATASRRAGRYLAASWPLPGPALAETWLRAGHLAWPGLDLRWAIGHKTKSVYGKCMGNTWKGWPGLDWPGLALAGLVWPGLRYLARPGLDWSGLG